MTYRYAVVSGLVVGFFGSIVVEFLIWLTFIGSLTQGQSTVALVVVLGALFLVRAVARRRLTASATIREA